MGAVLNDNSPEELISNFPPSSAVSTNQVFVSDASTSDASKVRTAVVFSATFFVISEVVIVGASLTLVTVMVTSNVPLIAVGVSSSVTLTVTLYSLFVSLSAGFSKSGTALNLSS